MNGGNFGEVTATLWHPQYINVAETMFRFAICFLLSPTTLPLVFNVSFLSENTPSGTHSFDIIDAIY